MTARMLLALLLLAGAARAEPPARFALVLGNNVPLPDSDYSPLSYADDDAVRVARLLGQLGARVELLAAPDAEVSERFADEAARARPPTLRELEAAVERLAAAIAEAEAPREVFVYFSGHGSVSSSDAHLHLLDGPLHRTDLYTLVLDRLPRERMHVIIDSCHSYFLVNARGRAKAEPERTELSRYPEVGFLLSTADRREVHEWSGYRGGVFTYQVLGAMHGAADVDGDGVVTYGETHAYVVAANITVRNPRARIHPFVRRPMRGPDALVDLRGERRVVVPAELAGRLRVHDANGYPMLDANKPAGDPLRLVMPDPRAALAVGAERFTLDPAVGAFVPAPPDHEVVASRGAIDDDFRKNLFRRPFTAEFVSGFEAAVAAQAAPPPREAPSWTDDPLTVTLGATGVAALAAGGVLTGFFLDAQADADARPVTRATEDARGRAEGYRAGLVAAYATGGVLLGTAVLNAVLGRTDDVRHVRLDAATGLLGLVGAF